METQPDARTSPTERDPSREIPSARWLIARATAACERNEYAAALQDLSGVIEQHPDFADVRNQAGFCRAMLGDAEGALDEFGHAIELNPGYTEAHLNRAIVLSELARLDEAELALGRAGEESIRSAGALRPELADRIALTHGELGDLYSEAGDTRAAIEEYERALRIRPTFADIRMRLARGLIAAGEPEAAVGELRRVLDERPSYVEARIRMGIALRGLDRLEEAVEEWRKCVELDPANRMVSALLASAGWRDGAQARPEDEEVRG